MKKRFFNVESWQRGLQSVLDVAVYSFSITSSGLFTISYYRSAVVGAHSQ